MKRSQRLNTLQICPRRDSNSGDSDLWSNTLPLDHRGAPNTSMVDSLINPMFFIDTYPVCVRAWVCVREFVCARVYSLCWLVNTIKWDEDNTMTIIVYYLCSSMKITKFRLDFLFVVFRVMKCIIIIQVNVKLRRLFLYSSLIRVINDNVHWTSSRWTAEIINYSRISRFVINGLNYRDSLAEQHKTLL